MRMYLWTMVAKMKMFSSSVSLQTVVNKMLVIANCLVPTCVPSSRNGLKRTIQKGGL